MIVSSFRPLLLQTPLPTKMSIGHSISKTKETDPEITLFTDLFAEVVAPMTAKRESYPCKNLGKIVRSIFFVHKIGR